MTSLLTLPSLSEWPDSSPDETLRQSNRRQAWNVIEEKYFKYLQNQYFNLGLISNEILRVMLYGCPYWQVLMPLLCCNFIIVCLITKCYKSVKNFVTCFVWWEGCLRPWSVCPWVLSSRSFLRSNMRPPSASIPTWKIINDGWRRKFYSNKWWFGGNDVIL